MGSEQSRSSSPSKGVSEAAVAMDEVIGERGEVREGWGLAKRERVVGKDEGLSLMRKRGPSPPRDLGGNEGEKRSC